MYPAAACVYLLNFVELNKNLLTNDSLKPLSKLHTKHFIDLKCSFHSTLLQCKVCGISF